MNISCSQNNWEYSKTTYNTNNKFKLGIDSIEIDLDSISLPEYLSKSAILERNDTITLYVYNGKTENIDIFNLNNKQVSHIYLNKEGVDRVSENIMSLQIISYDSIFIYDGINYMLINQKGNVFWKSNATFQKSNKIFNLESAFFTKLFYSSKYNRIYGRYISTGKGYPFPEENMFAYYDIEKDSLVEIPSKIPEYIKNNHSSLGRNSTLHAFFYDDIICYNFSFLSDIFIYNISNKKTSKYGGKSSLMKENIIFYDGNFNDTEKKWRHFLESTNYNPIIYNPYTNLYYRVSFGDFIDDADYTSLGHFQKKIYLTVFNKDLEIIFESKLPNYKFNFLDYFPIKDGILTFGNNPLNNGIDYEKIVFYKIELKL